MKEQPMTGDRYQGYTNDMTDDQVRAAFRKRHGVDPAEIIRDPTIVMAGPIPAADVQRSFVDAHQRRLPDLM